MLGLAFKPNTHDMREAASIVTAENLILGGAKVVAYDPIAVEKALNGADTAFIMTEWDEVKKLRLVFTRKY